MKKKKGELESGEPIIIWVVVILIILLVAFFFFRTRIDLWIKNLPEYQRNDGEDIEIVPDEVQIAICPDGYEEIGRFESGTSNSFFHIKEGNSYRKTSIEWLTGQNNVIIDKWGWFREITIGPNIPSGPHERKIEVDNSIFTRGSSKFVDVLKKELDTGDELFKALILLDNSVIKGLGGPNYVCQKKEVWNDLDKKLNLIYWGVENPRIIDLRAETANRISEISFTKIINSNTIGPIPVPVSYKAFNLSNYFYFKPTSNQQNTKAYLVIQRTNEKIKLKQLKKETLYLEDIIVIKKDGLILLNKKIDLEPTVFGERADGTPILIMGDYVGWWLDINLRNGAETDEWKLVPIKVDYDEIIKRL